MAALAFLRRVQPPVSCCETRVSVTTANDERRQHFWLDVVQLLLLDPLDAMPPTPPTKAMPWKARPVRHVSVRCDLWYHLAMNFGATASVWNKNRGADALQQLLRVLLLLAPGHPVDDFTGLDDRFLGESRWPPSRTSSRRSALTKVSKAQHPAKEHVAQGST